MENIYNSCIHSEMETCQIEVDLPPYYIEETIDYDGTTRIHGYYDLDEAKSDFADFQADMTIIAAALYCNVNDDGPCVMDVFSHRNSYVQAEFNCTFSNEKIKDLFAAWLEMNNIDFHRFQSDDGSYEIHVYCATDWEESATIQWLNANAVTNAAE